MFNNLFSIHYNDKLILEYLQNSKRGAVISNILAPIFVILASYGYVTNHLMAFWYMSMVILYFLRINSSIKLKSMVLNKKIKMQNYYFKINISAIFITSLLYGLASWVVIFNAPDANIFLVGTIIIALSAGSIATIGTIFIVFTGFMLLSIIPFTVALIYHGTFIFDIYALLLLVYLLTHLSSGYRLFIVHQKSIELENKFTTIFNKSTDGIVIIKDNRVIECNERVIKMFGFKNNLQEFIQTPIANMSPSIQPDNSYSRRKMLSMLKKAKNHVTTFEWLHTKKDGSFFWVEITLRSMYINNEKIIHGVWKDINDKKLAEKALEEFNRTLEQKIKKEVTKNRLQDQQLLQQSRLAQMGEMLSMIAHQWRQPLNSISMTANNLSLKCMMGEVDQKLFEKELTLIDQYSQHLSKTINDFRDFFKDHKDKEIVNLDEIIQSTISIIQPSLNNHNIKLISLVNSKVMFQTYPSEVTQVLLNILKNAEDALLENKIKNPTITIDAISNLDKNKHIVIIKDNAGGIPKKIIKNIFDPYFSTKLKKDGTGLGLYMSKTIIEEHCNGKLSVTNDKNGAVFRVEI